MSPERLKEVTRSGGKASAISEKHHRWTPEDAKKAVLKRDKKI